MTDANNYCGIWSLIFATVFVVGFFVNHLKSGNAKTRPNNSVSSISDYFVFSHIYFWLLGGNGKKDK